MSYYKRNLPHYHPEGAAFFITTRLAGTIPKNIYNKIKSEFEIKLEKVSSYQDEKFKRQKYAELQKYKFAKYERILDSCKYGHKWLGDEVVANVVKKALHYRDKNLYNLIAYTIMPNHIHIIFKPIVEQKATFAQFINEEEISDSQDGQVGKSLYIVTKIMQDLKKYTAGRANKIMKRTGKFWQHESFDHVLRDKKELLRIAAYILNNPVKATLCNSQEEWKWNYYNPEYLV